MLTCRASDAGQATVNGEAAMRTRPAIAAERRTECQLAYHRNRRRRWQRVRHEIDLGASRRERERQLALH